MHSVNRYNFEEEVLECPKVALVNFWVRSSEVCKMMRLFMKQIETEHHDEWKIVEIDWETERDLSRRYQVYGVPSLLVFHRGKVVGRYSGLIDVNEFIENGDLANLQTADT